MQYVITIFILGLLILFHELGHFGAAMWMKIPVERFSVGFGPKMLGFKKGETEYRLSWIPVGGYVLPQIEDEEEFFNIPVDKRIVFSIMGPVVNLILPVFLFAAVNLIKFSFSFYRVLVEPFIITAVSFAKMAASLGILFTQPGKMSGIVGIVAMGGKIVESGIVGALQFAAMLSLNLALINLIPIPVMDGGKILLYLLEKINPKLRKLHFPLALAGWIFVLGLMIYATALDLGRFFG